MFEQDIAKLDDCLGDFEPADLAWISNTRLLIRKYSKMIGENPALENSDETKEGVA